MASALVKKIMKTEDCATNLFSEKGRVYSFLNPVSYLDARRDVAMFNQLDGVFADGSLLVAAIRLVYGKKVLRRSFDMTSLASELFAYADTNKSSCYVVASRQEEVEKAVMVLKNSYPHVNFIGYRNGYFLTHEEQNEEAMKVSVMNPDFLIVGMGGLKQEEFMLKVKERGFHGIGFTCGGFIHQTARNKMDYYPTWMNYLNLRFIYRMIKEKHTRKRYIKAALLFPMKFIYDRFCD